MDRAPRPEAGELDPVVALFGLMSRQHGVASRRQAHRLGVTAAAERRLLHVGAVRPLLPGVLVAGGSPPSFAARAMAAALQPGVSAVSHGTAARLHGLDVFGADDRLHVVGSRGAHLRLRPPVITHHTRGALDREIVRIAAIPVTSVALTLILVAGTADADTTRRALADAVAAGLDRHHLAAVARAWSTPGRPGPATILGLLGRLGP
jgi:hypothetical protein